MSAEAPRPPLDAARLAAVDPDVVPGLRVEVLEELPSTNTVVADRARDGADGGLVVVTEHQSAGRGRLDRSWLTPPRSGLTFSVLLRPTVPASEWPWLPLLTGYAVSKALLARGFAATLKWPNDVLLQERKVAGVLSEVVEGGTGPAVVVGVGINVGMTAAELPVPEATSLLVAGGPDGLPDRTELLLEVLGTLWEGYLAWQEGGEPAAERLAGSYAAACSTLGRAVRVDVPHGAPVVGRATALDRSGRLLVSTADGDRVVGAGDVVHVRPA